MNVYIYTVMYIYICILLFSIFNVIVFIFLSLYLCYYQTHIPLHHSSSITTFFTAVCVCVCISPFPSSPRRKWNSPWTCWTPTRSCPTCLSSWPSFSLEALRAPASPAAAAAAKAPGLRLNGGSTPEKPRLRLGLPATEVTDRAMEACIFKKVKIVLFTLLLVCCTVPSHKGGSYPLAPISLI